MMIPDDHILVFFYVVLFVTPVFSNGSQDKKACLQWTKKGYCCKLPFNYEGKTYYGCTKDGKFVSRIYFWCLYNDNGNYDECADSIYRPSKSMVTTMEQTTAYSSTVADILIHIKMSSSVSAEARAFSVVSHSSNVGQRHINSTQVTTPSSSVKYVVNISTKSKKSKSSSGNRARYAVLIGGLVGGIFIIALLGITVAVYFKRNKSKARKESQTEQEPDSRIASDEAENPIYESTTEIGSEDSRNETSTKASRGMSEHVYQEVDNAQNCNVNDVNIVDSYSPVNDKDGFIHFNELYASA